MIVIMRDAVMPECCKTCVCSEGYGCGITGTLMTTKEMESRPDWCPLEEVKPCEDAVSRNAIFNLIENWDCQMMDRDAFYMDVEDLPSVTPKQRWIPVTLETLPNPNSVVVVCGKKGTWDYGTYRGWYGDIHSWQWKNNTIKHVYWWMYKTDALPEPYREEGEDK